MMSESKSVLLVGAGGHAKVCIEAFRAQGLYDPIACLDPNAGVDNLLGVPVYSVEASLKLFFAKGVRLGFVCIGQNTLRIKLGTDLRNAGFRMVNAISPSAHVSPSATLGEGVLVMPGAVINAEAQIGDLCIINTNSIVEHDCTIGIACHVAPGATLGGRVKLEDGVFIGMGALVTPNRVIGRNSIVGAGATVISSVAEGVTVAGVPARQLVR